MGITPPAPAAVDLFCGAGGLSYGMKTAGVEIVAGIDCDPDCRHPFEANTGARFFEGDVAGLDASFLASLFPKGRPRVLAGCAPCQPFSPYRRGNSEGDVRCGLLNAFTAAVRAALPEIVVMENVPGLRRHAVFQNFLEALEDTGYAVTHCIIKCERYGVPQTRRRLVLLASRRGEIKLVPPTHDASSVETVETSIGRMEEIAAGTSSASDPLHRAGRLSEMNLRRIRAAVPGGSNRSLAPGLRAPCHERPSGRRYGNVYQRMEWTRPAPTITTQFFRIGSGRFGHPAQDRAISLREGALLQTFPPDYSFVPPGEPIKLKRVARLIGNAVPVRVGAAIGKSIMVHLHETRKVGGTLRPRRILP